MLKTPLSLTVAAGICACPALALAQGRGEASISPSNTRAAIISPTSGEASTTAIVGADADAAFATEFYRGRAVKDNAGKKIGDIASIQEDARGHRTITVKMGGQNVTLDAAQFGIHNDAVVVRLSYEQLSAMLQRPEN